MTREPRISLAGAVLVAALAACATAGQRRAEPPAPAPGERSVQRLSFAIDLPASGWAVALDRPNAIKLQLQGLPVFLEVEAHYLQPDQEAQPLQALARDSVRSMLRGFGDAAIVEEGPALVGGRPGWRLTLTGKSSSLPVQALELTVREGHRLFEVGLVGAQQLLGRGLVAWMRAADTLSLRIPPGDSPPSGASAAALADAAARALSVERDAGKAAALLARAVAADGSDPKLRERLLEAELAAGMPGRAVGALRAELAAHPERFDRWALLGALEMQRGRPAEATAALQSAARQPGCPAEIYKNLGAILLSQHRLPEAEGAFEGAVQRAPSDAAAFAGLGEVFLQEHQLAAALAAEERAAQLDPAEGQIHAILSEIQGDENHYEQAIAECMAALQRDIPKPLGATLRYNLACYQARLGHQRECLWWLRQALEAGFDDIELMKTDPDLASVRETAAFRELLSP
ncbi:MAG: TPR end-of-group domain-containing protein [Myxococcales bacterium]